MSRQIDSFRRYVALREPAPLAEPVPARPDVALFASGKGGVGTSTVAALSAVVAAERGSRVLLVDAGEGFSSLPLLLGVEAGPGLGELRGGETLVEELLIPVDESLDLLPLSPSADGGDRLSPTERRLLLRRLLPLFSRYHRVVVDGGSRLDPILTLCALGVDRIRTVTTTERVSVAATYALVKALAAHAPGVAVEVLVNRQEEGAAEAFAEIRAAAERFLDRDMAYAGAVPRDECLRAGIEAGMPLQEAAVGSPAALAFLQIDAGIPTGRLRSTSPAPFRPALL